jgi:pimeloyl-ACP methyl ester carboxylesterase
MNPQTSPTNTPNAVTQTAKNTRPFLVALLVLAMSWLFISNMPRVEAADTQPSAVKHGYAFVNGLKLYYEIRGTGQPLVLLHGGLGAIEMFGDVLPLLAKGRQVIAVDLQAHGRTADINRPLSYEKMADDIAALIKSLHLKQADVMGYSLGGEVALRTAIQHPEVVRKLVVVSAAFKRDGWYPEVLAGEAQMGVQSAEGMKGTPLHQVYLSLAPRPQDWAVLHTKLHDLLVQDYDWSKEVAGLKTPTMIVVGDADSVRTAHAVQFFELLGGGKKDAGWDGSGISSARLSILPGITHYQIFASPVLASTVSPFLDEAASKAK